VKCFHTSVEKLRCTGVFRNINDGKSGIAQGLGGAAGGEQFDSEVVQILGEGGEAGTAIKLGRAMNLCR
jgi:hypothetical protein